MGSIKFLDPVENSDAGGPSSITVWMEYSLLFNSDIVNFVWKTDDREAVLESSVDEGWWGEARSLI